MKRQQSRLFLVMFALILAKDTMVRAQDPCTHSRPGHCLGDRSLVNEHLIGMRDGQNTKFRLPGEPSANSDVHLYRNGLEQRKDIDYQIDGVDVTFGAGAIPLADDVLQVSYSVSRSSIGALFGEAKQALAQRVKQKLTQSEQQLKQTLQQKEQLVKQTLAQKEQLIETALVESLSRESGDLTGLDAVIGNQPTGTTRRGAEQGSEPEQYSTPRPARIEGERGISATTPRSLTMLSQRLQEVRKEERDGQSASGLEGTGDLPIASPFSFLLQAAEGGANGGRGTRLGTSQPVPQSLVMLEDALDKADGNSEEPKKRSRTKVKKGLKW